MDTIPVMEATAEEVEVLNAELAAAIATRVDDLSEAGTSPTRRDQSWGSDHSVGSAWQQDEWRSWSRGTGDSAPTWRKVGRYWFHHSGWWMEDKAQVREQQAQEDREGQVRMQEDQQARSTEGAAPASDSRSSEATGLLPEEAVLWSRSSVSSTSST